MERDDMMKTLVFVFLGVFIPFFFAIGFNFGWEIGNIFTSFGHFIIIFIIEVVIAYAYGGYTKRKEKKTQQNQNRGPFNP